MTDERAKNADEASEIREALDRIFGEEISSGISLCMCCKGLTSDPPEGCLLTRSKVMPQEGCKSLKADPDQDPREEAAYAALARTNKMLAMTRAA